jgi:hypothetical protein
VEARPGDNETLDIYGMKLAELAELAYPKSKKESAIYLRKQFLESISPSITTKIKDAERTLRVTSNGKMKFMKFANIMEMAKDLQKEDKPRTVMWSHQYNLPVETNLPVNYGTHGNHHNYQPSNAQHGRVYQNSSQREVSCSFCKRTNHTRKDCWRASKSCLICGKDHHLEQCPKFDPNRRTGRKMSGSFNQSPLN